MKHKPSFYFIMGLLFILSVNLYGQNERSLIQGKVLYRGSNVPNEDVINVTTEKATITNEEGEFSIMVAEGDLLAFMALNYELTTVRITKQILLDKRLVVEVNEKITELDEVVVNPENREKFILLKEEEFKQTAYNIDAASTVENIALPLEARGMKYGLNFVNIFRALAGTREEDPVRNPLPVSTVLREIYSTRFFVDDLQIPEEHVEEFLYYLDDKLPSRTLLTASQEFQLIDFLVNESRNFRDQMNSDDIKQ